MSSNWNFSRPDESDPGEHVFALVIYTGSGELGVRAMERAEVWKQWGVHAFAWQRIEYPTFTVSDAGRVVDEWRSMPAAPQG